MGSCDISWHPVGTIKRKMPQELKNPFKLRYTLKVRLQVNWNLLSILSSQSTSDLQKNCHVIENYFRTSVSRCEDAMKLLKLISLCRQIVIMAFGEIWENHLLELYGISLIYTIKRITLLNLHNKGIIEVSSSSKLITPNLLNIVIMNSSKLIKH